MTRPVTAVRPVESQEGLKPIHMAQLGQNMAPNG